jgi:hypothetical protein
MDTNLMDADLDIQDAVDGLRMARKHLVKVIDAGAYPAAAEALARVDAAIETAQVALAPLAADISAAYKAYEDAGGNAW